MYVRNYPKSACANTYTACWQSIVVMQWVMHILVATCVSACIMLQPLCNNITIGSDRIIMLAKCDFQARMHVHNMKDEMDRAGFISSIQLLFSVVMPTS